MKNRKPWPLTEPYTAIQNRIVEDDRLTPDALGVLLWCLSKPNDWNYNLSRMAKRFNIGAEKMSRIMRQLRECGYAEIIYPKDDVTGRISGKAYLITDTPKNPISGKSRRSGKPRLGKTEARENPASTNKGDILKTDKEVKTDPGSERDKLIRQIGERHVLLFEELSIDHREERVKQALPFLEYLFHDPEQKCLGYHSMKELITFIRSLSPDLITQAVKYSVRCGYKGLHLPKNKQDEKRKFGDYYKTKRGV